MTRVVVTGASGFLGRHVCWRLEREADVVGVSRRGAAGTTRVAGYDDTPGGDVLIHLAETNVRGVAEQAGDAYERDALALITSLAPRFNHVVYISSAAVYDDQARTPRGIGDPVIAGNVYTRAKLACEAEVIARGGSVARMANAYGPGMSDATVLSAILGQIPGHGALRVRDDTPVRDFLWAGDAADALAFMAGQARSGIYNVGSGKGVSIRDLASAALAVAGEAGRDIVATAPSPKHSYLVLDIAATTAAFGWTPRTDLAAGLARLIRPAQSLQR